MSAHSTIAHNLKKLLDKEEITLTDLARESGIGKPQVSRILAGKTTNPQIETLAPIAKFFGISIDQLIGSAPLPCDGTYGIVIPIDRLVVPIIEWQYAPCWLELKNQFRPHQTIDVKAKSSPDSYALIIEDTCYEPRFTQHSIIVVDPSEKPENRDYIITRVTAEGPILIKQFIHENNKKFLKNVNLAFHMETIHDHFACFGVIKEAHLKF